jgi:hypothetical protein
MRPEPNNDIDLLLRQLSRRNGAPVSEIDEQHLDADELNSYVANALPAGARARYTTHLADCSTCRKLVVELSAAHGLVPMQQVPTPVAPSGLKSFLASLFSPMVLRYAVPALGLIVVAVIGIFVMRQNRRAASIALNDSPQSKPAVVVPQDAETSQYVSPDAGSRARTETAQRQPVAPNAREDQAAPVTKSTSPAANQTVDASGAAAAPPPAPKPVPAETESGRVAEFQKEKKADLARDETKERAEGDKNQPQKGETAAVTVTPGSVTRKDIDVRPAKSTAAPATGGGTGASAGQDMKRAPSRVLQAQSSEEMRDEAKHDKAAGETRSVAGRRFRKSARVWIDTGFDSSKPITTVERGSEQFRALVADEPSIRTIANELDGEIVVVWKGRTYRIR